MIKLYVNWEMEGLQEETVVGQYGLLSQHVHEDTEKSGEELVWITSLQIYISN